MLTFKRNVHAGEWCVRGDFNEVKNQEEIKGEGTHVNSREIDELQQFDDNLELVDVLVVGNRFTWFKFDSSCIRMLDRFLLSESLILNWKVIGQMVGEREREGVVFDHSPI